MSKQNFNNLMWFIGVVEDVNDPISAGRVRVRCFDIHPPVGDDVPTEALPWSIPINGSYGFMHQIPKVSEWVFGFFLDGRDAQHPFLLGTIPGVNSSLPQSNVDAEAATSTSTSTSTTGANAETPTNTLMNSSSDLATILSNAATNLPMQIGAAANSLSAVLGDINPYLKSTIDSVMSFGQNAIPPQLSGVDIEQTPLAIQEMIRRTGTNLGLTADGTALGGFNEPGVAFGGQPSYNSVWSGGYGKSYIEVNGTDRAEHITISHSSGSHVQIDGNGNVKIRSLHDAYFGTEGHASEHIGGRKELFIEGNFNINVESHCNFNVKGDFNLKCNDFNVMARGRASFNVAEAAELRAARIALQSVSENVDIFSNGKIKVGSNGKISVTSGEDISVQGVNVNLEATGDGNFLAAANLNLEAGSLASLKGSIVGIDDIVYMASGQSNSAAASNPELAVTIDWSAPEAKEFVSTNGGNSSASTPSGGFSWEDDTADDSGSSGTTTAASSPANPLATPNKTSIAALEADPAWNAAMEKILADNPGLTKEELYRVIQGESGYNTTAVSSAGAVGLFQLTPTSASELGYTAAQIQQMSAADQLGVYGQYLSHWNYSGGNLGIMQAAPAYASRSPSTVVYSVGSAEWIQNPGWRPADGGAITVQSINNYYSGV